MNLSAQMYSFCICAPPIANLSANPFFRLVPFHFAAAAISYSSSQMPLSFRAEARGECTTCSSQVPAQLVYSPLCCTIHTIHSFLHIKRRTEEECVQPTHFLSLSAPGIPLSVSASAPSLHPHPPLTHLSGFPPA